MSEHRVPARRSMPLTRLRGKPGFVDSTLDDVERFEAVTPVRLP
ncbi:hypothetical protein [Salinactinospora qingdaonensis]